MLFDVSSEAFGEKLMEGLKKSLEKSYTQGKVTVNLSASMGVVIAPMDGTKFEDLYKKADKALYQVKKEGKNGCKRYVE